ncbi:MAG: phosphatidate cytidylyltransferase [Planctomycetes bacterium]|nr:phosphatidate cytidylyltransferase [Planctomycetota bacterium]
MTRLTPKQIRVYLGLLILLAVIGLFALDRFLESRICVSAAISAMGLAGFFEYVRLTRLGSAEAGGSRLLAAAGLLATAYFWALAWWEGLGGRPLPAELLAAGAVGFLLVGFLVLIVSARGVEGLPHLLAALLGVVALGWLLSYVVRIYQAGDPTTALIRSLVFFFGVKGTDIVAYLAGSTFGRHHFLKISPGKTLEGSLAGLVFGLLWFAGAGWLQPERLFGWPVGILFGIILASAAALGDLSESLIKRHYRVKDSSGLLPEFGGVLDMIDSFLFTAFIFWCLL